MRKLLLIFTLTALMLSLIAAPTARAQEDDMPDWDAILRATWAGYQDRYIFCGEPCGDDMGLVFDPSAGHFVSEGVGYGLLMAVFMDDQPTFDVILDAANAILYHESSGLYNWRANAEGTVTGSGAATDADEDIALALVFAQAKVDAGEWEQHATSPYGEQANALIDALFRRTVYQGEYLIPGNQWYGGTAILNPSYFAPAWYRIFDAFQGSDRWGPVIDSLYETLYAGDGAALGIAPDWSAADGQPAFEWCDWNSRAREDCRYEMTWEAIRVPWRIALDCLWFGEERACEWSARGAAFLVDQVGGGDLETAARGAGMFTLAGGRAVDFQTEGMVGMWLAGAMASGDARLAAALADWLLTGYGAQIEQGMWGSTPDAGQYYYNQSLAWLGAAVYAGVWDAHGYAPVDVGTVD